MAKGIPLPSVEGLLQGITDHTKKKKTTQLVGTPIGQKIFIAMVKKKKERKK